MIEMDIRNISQEELETIPNGAKVVVELEEESHPLPGGGILEGFLLHPIYPSDYDEEEEEVDYFPLLITRDRGWEIKDKTSPTEDEHEKIIAEMEYLNIDIHIYKKGWYLYCDDIISIKYLSKCEDFKVEEGTLNES